MTVKLVITNTPLPRRAILESSLCPAYCISKETDDYGDFSYPRTMRTAICRKSAHASFHYCPRSTGDPMVDVFSSCLTIDLSVCLVHSLNLHWIAQIRGESRDRGRCWCFRTMRYYSILLATILAVAEKIVGRPMGMPIAFYQCASVFTKGYWSW